MSDKTWLVNGRWATVDYNGGPGWFISSSEPCREEYDGVRYLYLHNDAEWHKAAVPDGYWPTREAAIAFLDRVCDKPASEAPAPRDIPYVEGEELRAARHTQGKQAKKITRMKEAVRQLSKVLHRRSAKLRECIARLKAINGDKDEFRKLIAEKDAEIKRLQQELVK